MARDDRGSMIQICQECGEEYNRRVEGKYCSQICFHKAVTTKVESKCLSCGKIIMVSPYKIPRGWGKYCSKKCMGLAKLGENNNLWKGGISSENNVIRNSAEYRNWRKEVYARDNWTCQDCGKRGGELHTHHVFSFVDFPEHRFEIWNGTTLCRLCHAKIHPNLNLNKHLSLEGLVYPHKRGDTPYKE